MYSTCWFNVVSATNHLVLDFFYLADIVSHKENVIPGNEACHMQSLHMSSHGQESILDGMKSTNSLTEAVQPCY
jgi:hypothetical protein